MQINVRQVSDLLDVSEKTIYRWINERRLPAHRIGGQYRFSQSEILQWAIEQQVNVTHALLTEPEGKPVRFHESLARGGIFYRVGGGDVASVLKQVVSIIPLPEMVDRAFLIQVLLAREAMESTGIGDGIAIPHARNPIIQHLVDPMVSLCFLEHPVDFHAIDKKPVHTLFTVVSPSTRAHLQLVSRLSYMLRAGDFCDAVNQQHSREHILQAAERAEAALP